MGNILYILLWDACCGVEFVIYTLVSLFIILAKFRLIDISPCLSLKLFPLT